MEVNVLGGGPVQGIHPGWCRRLTPWNFGDGRGFDERFALPVRPDAPPQKVNVAPFDVLQYEVKFIVTKSATLNPTFKQGQSSIGPTGTLGAGSASGPAT